ncbi:hypothetical protein KGM_215480 [Danaus plexippus plexippus]|uniref:Uncharacterized protein n=1 Tax=Danaus plexippus plexippus TaxID=278856 RepID=A0A212F5D0_DANPL|nr:hypothetical protein KGM_215480 [Danaus plexippus plexippus]
MNDSDNAEKRQALKRLFGRFCSVEMENEQQDSDELFDDNENERSNGYVDENDDPLLDSVPVDMDPEQLGFLVCAQETLRFLHGRGISTEHPVFTRLRLRLLRGIAYFPENDAKNENRKSISNRCIPFEVMRGQTLVAIDFHLYTRKP